MLSQKSQLQSRSLCLVEVVGNQRLAKQEATGGRRWQIPQAILDLMLSARRLG